MQIGYSYDAGESKFTGKERDAESGLDNFGARYYGSSLGRFVQGDRKAASARPGDPQTWNRYAYVTNRPLIFIDPDGLDKYLVIYVEQPNPGTRDRQAGAFGTNLGHSFIGLRDTDKHTNVRVGFYPKDGTSLDVARGKTVSGTIKNNDQHSYNIEKDIKVTDKQYQNVVDSVKKDAANPPNFNLYNENCTDWVIQKAAAGGVTLPSNSGGEGSPNNPADLGQDLSYQGASPIPYNGPDQGSSESVDPQKTNDLTPLNQVPSSDQERTPKKEREDKDNK
jgi:RHS repeat-associated protein